MATPTIQFSQYDVTSIVAGENAQVAQYDVTVIYNFPSEFAQLSQYDALTVTQSIAPVRVSQYDVVAVVRGSVFNPRLRAWWFDLDGHEFYVLNLGNDKTLVYDLTTQKWSWWSYGDLLRWRASTGTNWTQSGSVAFDNGSDVVVGDDSTGILWVLDPMYGVDDSVRAEARALEITSPFPRVATGQVLARARTFIPCYEVFLTVDTGAPAFPTARVTLRYSDDGGRSYVSAGDISVQAGNYYQDIVWRSLGQINPPGRMFQVEDDGAFRQIDDMMIADTDG